MNHDLFDPTDNQCVLSYELLLLLQWLVEHHHKDLQVLIKKALTLGLNEQLKRLPHLPDQQTVQDMHQGVLAFFDEMEVLLNTSTREQHLKKRVHNSLIPAAEHIDNSVCDRETIADSIVHASEICAENPGENPRDVLLEELLRQWQPGEKTSAN